MNTRQLIRHSKTLFNSNMVPVDINRANRKKWVRMVLWLGDRWLLANPIARRS